MHDLQFLTAIVAFILAWLAIGFIGLKLTGYITWSWWWVLSPVWIPVTSVLMMLAFVWALVRIFSRFE